MLQYSSTHNIMLAILYLLLDINECDNSSTCGENQVCFNTAGSYLCECDYGYERDPNSMIISPGVYRGCKGGVTLYYSNGVYGLKQWFSNGLVILPHKLNDYH